MKIKKRLAAMAGALLIVGGLAVANAPAAFASETIVGTARCNVNPIVGVWVASSGSGSGFASWSAHTDASGPYVTYSREGLPNGASYSLHVGCGGSTSSWAYTTYSSSSTATNRDLVCNVGYIDGATNHCWDS